MTRSKKQYQSFYLSLPLPVPTPSFPFPLRRRSGLQGGVRRSIDLAQVVSNILADSLNPQAQAASLVVRLDLCRPT